MQKRLSEMQKKLWKRLPADRRKWWFDVQVSLPEMQTAGRPVKMVVRHSGFATRDAKTAGRPVKMVVRHSGFATRDANTLHLGQLFCISASKTCMSNTQFPHEPLRTEGVAGWCVGSSGATFAGGGSCLLGGPPPGRSGSSGPP